MYSLLYNGEKNITEKAEPREVSSKTLKNDRQGNKRWNTTAPNGKKNTSGIINGPAESRQNI